MVNAAFFLFVCFFRITDTGMEERFLFITWYTSTCYKKGILVWVGYVYIVLFCLLCFVLEVKASEKISFQNCTGKKSRDNKCLSNGGLSVPSESSARAEYIVFHFDRNRQSISEKDRSYTRVVDTSSRKKNKLVLSFFT